MPVPYIQERRILPPMRRFGAFVVVVSLSGVVACGGSCPPPVEAAAVTAAKSEPASGPEEAAAEPSEHAAPAEKSESAPAATAADAKPSEAEADPAFPEDASVAQAMAKVPQGTSRANIDPERLGESLQNEAVYAPCNVGGQHFKVHVAVWNGRAVGVDVTTPNKKLAACIDKQIRAIEWKDKVRSLNTVEYSM
jgi:hypothetical protein